MSSTPKIICRVKAIYPFYSNEPSSLNFEKDDYIDVLAQLDSGWWDGWCGGSRGWFPSNYVQVVEDNVADTESLIDYDKEEPVAPSEPIAPPRQERPTVKTRRRRSSSGKRRRARPHSLSYPTQTVNLGWTGRISTIYSSDDDESIARAEMLPEGWSMQVAEDGRTYYYYNHRTGKMQYEHPGTLSDDDSDDGYIYRRQSVDSFGEVQYNKPSAGNRLSLDSLPADVETPDPTISDSSPNIMSQWVERKTPQGRTYYCNLVTQETTWNLDDVDLKTGRLKNVRDSLSDSEEEAAVNHIRQQSLRDMPERADPHYDEEEAAAAANMEKPSTWQKLSSDTALAIHQLSIAVQRGDQQSINDNAWSVVDTIRVMLYASGSLDKDASHMQDRALRDPQRAIMASLSKLVLSVKSASESPKPETLYRVQRDAGDVLAAVRAFVTACQDKRVGIIQVRPQLLVDTCHASAAPENDATPEGGATNNKEDANEENNEKTNRRASQELPAVQKAKYSLNQDLVISLQTHANQIFGSTDALSKATAYVLKIYTEPVNDDEMQDGRRDSVKARSNVVILFRNLSMQLGQYLSILEDVDMGNVDGSKIPSLPDFRVSKQGMYNAVGYLFHAVQTLSNEDGDLATATNALEDAIRQCETVVENVLRNVEDMVEQRKIWYMKTSLPDRDAAMSPTAAAADDVEDGGLDFPVIRSGLEKPRKSQYTIRPPEARSADWCLGYDYAPDELVFSSDGNVKGGTLRALVERLTLHDALDTSFIATFLLTYRSFCTTEELFSLLEQRYELQPSEGLTPFELETWTERKQKLVRLRVFNVMKSWLENYYNDEDEFILSRLEFFTNTVIRDASPFSADQLNRLIRKRKELNANKGLKKLVPNAMAGPLPIIPKDMSRVTLLDIDPLELSRQLSLLDFKLYSNIRPSECLNKAWSREDAGGNIAIHVKQSIDYCNRLTCWVSDSILANQEAKKRVVVIKYWAQVAARCRQLNNYNTCMAIISAFDNSAVGRLRKTWELVGNRTTQTLGHIRKLMGANRNFQEYREMIHSVNPPCIPFLGIYLQDLTFIEDGNPDFINKPLGLINFAKRQKAAEVIREINQFQSPPYTFQAVSELQAFIKSHLESSRDIDKLYERSLQLEPREPAP